jgi:hypothetical protein
MVTELTLAGATSGLTLAAAASVAGAVAYVVAVRLAFPANFRRQLDFARLMIRGQRA